jgi:hypothetical protein
MAALRTCGPRTMMGGSMICRHGLALLGLAVLIPASAQDQTEMFNLSKTCLDKAAARRLAEDLVEYAQGCCKASPEFAVIGEYRKIVRVAYQLAPESPSWSARTHASRRGSRRSRRRRTSKRRP